MRLGLTQWPRLARVWGAASKKYLCPWCLRGSAAQTPRTNRSERGRTIICNRVTPRNNIKLDSDLSCTHELQPCIMIARLNSIIRPVLQNTPARQSQGCAMSITRRRIPWSFLLSGILFIGLATLIARNWRQIEIKSLEALALI